MPAIATIDEANLHLIGDVHGCGWRVARLLEQAGWDTGQGAPVPPPGSLLIQMGDLIDRGKQMARHRRTACGSGGGLAERVARIAGRATSRLMVPAPERLGAPPVSLLALASGDVAWPRAMVDHQRKLLAHACDSVETLRFFMQLETRAAAAGARVLCLLGNHEADLLRGRFCHARKQKTYLLALLGVPLDAIVAHGKKGLPPGQLEQLRVPELSWLLELPVMAAGQGILAVHGGPCERLVSTMESLGLRDLGALGAVFQEAREAGYDHPLTEEGASVLSPGRPEDDMFLRPVLLHRLLALAGAETLAVGHSPFLHFPRGRWVDIDDPEVRERLEAPAFLGCHGEVLKLDTDMKRGGPAWMVSRDPETGRWTALREDGFRASLTTTADRRGDQHLEDAPGVIPSGGPPEAEEDPSWPLDGVDADTLQQVHGGLEDLRAAGEEETADRIQKRLASLLHAGVVDLAPVVHGLRWRGARLAAWRGWFEAWADKVADRFQAWQVELENRVRSTREREVRFLKPPGACRVEGHWVQMLPPVAVEVARNLAAGGEGAGPERIITGGYVSGQGRSRLRVHRFGAGGKELSLAEVPVTNRRMSLRDVAETVATVLEQDAGTASGESLETGEGARGGSPADRLARRGKLYSGPPVEDPRVRRYLEAWFQAACGFLPPGARAFLVAEDGRGRAIPDRYLVDLGEPAPIPVVRLPGGAWLPANTAFTDPKRRYPVVLSNGRAGTVAEVDHATWLLRYLEQGAVNLYSAVSPDVATLLYRADVDAIGLPDPRRPIWQRGRYLFLSPSEDIGRYFFNKSVTVRFVVPRPRVESAVAAGLMSANLFLADRGEVLDPRARFGATDIGLELVAVGSDGIGWLLDFLVR